MKSGIWLIIILGMVLVAGVIFFSSDNPQKVKGLVETALPVENIRPGVYEIEAVLEGKKRRTSEKMTIAVAEGQVIELDIRLKR